MGRNCNGLITRPLRAYQASDYTDNILHIWIGIRRKLKCYLDSTRNTAPYNYISDKCIDFLDTNLIRGDIAKHLVK